MCDRSASTGIHIRAAATRKERLVCWMKGRRGDGRGSQLRGDDLCTNTNPEQECYL